ncbi:lysine N(6)-hydroxylase/L-ornithine N(5)-oxygenase family protein [Nocardia sp. CDC159]|uniref:L-lysine N6-monooxygenase MbtG n=1 Tax=Nocardia pulmonis TaxID=2951408 RepID=A0A9X2IVF9_9NOCA|nr:MULTISPECIES: lysine N(6)-hydroxylase/L-ornithine N(5)-oxygenase family protein [Nocardia]MCM6773183.1 lysine N(6)-hydroxylase/L-ornithine N(5)-oxygenase family protein [Nocardia pulmonis]MCM6785514.1 lysine N(6)-hydroxylase/L-ornithine N(5)-oxygenase family protein [Nocardia sp. CDC159]
MESAQHEIYDVVGIGFGPSNLALALALGECESERFGSPLTSVFFERQRSFGWHRGMMLPNAKMQISFLKDLVTFRNPTSRFSFIAYLHATGRLARFVNNQDFFPTRREFHDYLEWVESGLSGRVAYGSEVVALRRPHARSGEGVDHLLVDVRGTADACVRTVRARNVVVSTGLVPRMPDGLERDEHVWHSSEFLHRFDAAAATELKRWAVVGAGQSAAEIVRFLYDTIPDATIAAIIPSYGYSIADDTPFANSVFDPEGVDGFYNGSGTAREAIWRYHRNTNYSVVDAEVIRDLHRRLYDDEVGGTQRLDFIKLARVLGVKSAANDTRVTIRSTATGQTHDLDVDVLVCATGYDPMEPTVLLGEVERHCLRDEQGRLRVERGYRLTTDGDLACGIYLQGGTEHTHGLSSSLLSNVAVRSGEIANAIVDARVSAWPTVALGDELAR